MPQEFQLWYINDKAVPFLKQKLDILQITYANKIIPFNQKRNERGDNGTEGKPLDSWDLLISHYILNNKIPLELIYSESLLSLEVALEAP